MEFDSLKNMKRFYHHFSEMNGNHILKTKNHEYCYFPDSVWPNINFNLKIEANELQPWINDIQIKIKEEKHPVFLMFNEKDTSTELFKQLKAYQPDNRYWVSMTYDLNKKIDIKRIGNFEMRQINSKLEIDKWCDVLEQSLMKNRKVEKQLLYKVAKSELIEFYTGYEKGKAVCVSMLFKDENWAGIYCVGTLPGYERKGYGKAITQFAMQKGLEKGCKEAVLQATQSGEPLYDNIGYDNRGRIELINLEQK
jgi:GNAT superfamily N-acetyltransferase